MEGTIIIPVHPRASQQYIIGIDINEQEVHEIIYFTEASFDEDLSQGPLFALVKALFD